MKYFLEQMTGQQAHIPPQPCFAGMPVETPTIEYDETEFVCFYRLRVEAL